MSAEYIDSLLEVFQIMVRMGYLKRTHMPEFLLPRSKKIISSSEIEYDSEHKKYYFIKFKVVDYGDNDLMRDQFPDLYFIAFCPELWSLQGMEALSIHPRIVYSIVMIGNEFYIIGKQRIHVHKNNLRSINKGFKIIKNVMGEELSSIKVENFLTKKTKEIIPDEVIRNTYGSGVNVVSPGVYVDDFKLGQLND